MFDSEELYALAGNWFSTIKEEIFTEYVDIDPILDMIVNASVRQTPEDINHFKYMTRKKNIILEQWMSNVHVVERDDPFHDMLRLRVSDEWWT